jgi:hypothetical protein
MNPAAATPFKTHQAQLAELIDSYDRTHGTGSAQSRLDAHRATKPTGFTLKAKIALLKSPAASSPRTESRPMPQPSARSVAPVVIAASSPSIALPQAQTMTRVDYNALPASKRAQFTGQGGKVTSSLMTRTDFNAMRPAERTLFVLSGGKLTDDARLATAKPTPQGTIARAAFSNLSPTEQLAFCQGGGRIVG